MGVGTARRGAETILSTTVSRVACELSWSVSRGDFVPTRSRIERHYSQFRLCYDPAPGGKRVATEPDLLAVREVEQGGTGTLGGPSAHIFDGIDAIDKGGVKRALRRRERWIDAALSQTKIKWSGWRPCQKRGKLI